MTINSRKFLDAVCGILQKCGHLSEEIRWNIIQHSCCPILLYGLDSINLNTEQVRKMSVAYNIAVRCCFNLKFYTLVRNIVYYINCIPINMLLSEKRVLLVSQCLSQVVVLSLCALLESNCVGFSETCMKYNVHSNMSKSCVKACMKEAFLMSCIKKI